MATSHLVQDKNKWINKDKPGLSYNKAASLEENGSTSANREAKSGGSCSKSQALSSQFFVHSLKCPNNLQRH